MTRGKEGKKLYYVLGMDPSGRKGKDAAEKFAACIWAYPDWDIVNGVP